MSSKGFKLMWNCALQAAVVLKEHLRNEMLGLVPEHCDSLPDSVISLPSFCDLALDARRHPSATDSESAVSN